VAVIKLIQRHGAFCAAAVASTWHSRTSTTFSAARPESSTDTRMVASGSRRCSRQTRHELVGGIVKVVVLDTQRSVVVFRLCLGFVATDSTTVKTAISNTQAALAPLHTATSMMFVQILRCGISYSLRYYCCDRLSKCD
jgi:hypothetical protein